MREFTADRLLLNGAAPTAGQLQALALNGYGHFTAMQVRGGRVRGLELHLARLGQATAELFGTSLDGALVCTYIRHALGATADASVRVYVQRPEQAQPPSVLVVIRPPGGLRPEFRLEPVPYQRCLAHIKHLGDFGQVYYGQLAAQHGFDDALLTGPDGLVAEGSMTNIGFFDGNEVVWPAAAVLSGITMQLLQHGLRGQSVPLRYRPVRLADLSSYATVFVTNSRGIAPVAQVDDRKLPVDPEFMKLLADTYESAPWDPI
jgi:branched-subunit amino acid aminotransferase/4-amino-4-deoxychorismate lyase